MSNWTEEEVSAYYERLKGGDVNCPTASVSQSGEGCSKSIGGARSTAKAHPRVSNPAPARSKAGADGPLEIEITGFCAKKNRKAPNANGRGLHIEPNTRMMIKAMEIQIPGYARDRMIDSPSLVEWYVTYTNARIDFDGIMTTVLDILQKYRVIVNDNLAHWGGRQIIHPAVRGQDDTVRVVIWP